MQVVTMDCRTVSIVKPFTVEQRTGINGAFESKEVLFKIAVDRERPTIKIENGQQIKNHESDFFLAKATGGVAEVFNTYCTAKKENGKLASRQLMVMGHFETYQKDRQITTPVNFGGQVYDVTISVPDTPTIFIVEKIKFLDSNPQQVQNGTTGVVVGAPVPAGTATNAVQAVPTGQAPVAPATQSAPVTPAPTAPVAPAQPAPSVPSVPVAPATAMENAVAQVAQDMAQAMNPPTVAPGFIPAGNSAPF